MFGIARVDPHRQGQSMRYEVDVHHTSIWDLQSLVG